MIRLGHITYSNCLPVHAWLMECGAPGVEIVTGVPSELNEQLADGRIDVAPCSSIEYARHQDEYVVLPDFAIASVGAVQSILLETTRPLAELDGVDVMVPTASATSVVLLRILLETRHGVMANLRWFDQSVACDPLAGDAAAALWIGDVALRRHSVAGRTLVDLGALWTEWTGLPFVYAIWQARAAVDPVALDRLHALLLESRARFAADIDASARRHARRFGLPATGLAGYWRSLRYSLDEDAQRGLLHFYDLANGIGVAAAVDTLRWAAVGAR
jgi:chorismate dehydratase